MFSSEEIKEIIENLEDIIGGFNFGSMGYDWKYSNDDRLMSCHSYGAKPAMKYILGREPNLVFRSQISKSVIFSGIKNAKKKMEENDFDDDFALNLWFYEMLINATLNKSEAEDIIVLLNNPDVRMLKHLNYAALYLYCCRKWNIFGEYINYLGTRIKNTLTHSIIEDTGFSFAITGSGNNNIKIQVWHIMIVIALVGLFIFTAPISMIWRVFWYFIIIVVSAFGLSWL